MVREDLEAALRDLESDRSERTRSLTNTDKFGQAICAFANDLPNSREPGYLFIGANPDGSASGATVTEQLLEALAGIRSDGNLLPPPVINVQKWTLGGGEMAVLEVLPSSLPPVRYKGQVWIRVGPRKGVANEDEIRILSEKRTALARTWDARPCTESSLADIATDIFALSYLPQAVDAQARADDSRDVPDQMAGLRLFDIGAGAPTNAAVILFGTNPLYFIAGAYVQYVRYAGEDAGTEVLEDRRFTGDLLSVLRGVVALAKEVAVARPVAEGDTHERMVYDYPPKALHELLVNALIHRNYDGACAPTIVSHYSDRIEIQNPGGLYGDLTPELFPNGTAYRNPVLAEGARVLGFANRFGRGIALAQSELKRNGSPPASFVSDKPHFNAVVRKPQ